MYQRGRTFTNRCYCSTNATICVHQNAASVHKTHVADAFLCIRKGCVAATLNNLAFASSYHVCTHNDYLGRQNGCSTFNNSTGGSFDSYFQHGVSAILSVQRNCINSILLLNTFTVWLNKSTYVLYFYARLHYISITFISANDKLQIKNRDIVGVSLVVAKH